MQELDRLSAIERALILMKIPPFEELSAQQVSLIAVHTREVELAEGETLTSGTEEGDDAYIVTSGAVDVSLNGAQLRRVGAGDSFGFYSLARSDADEVGFRAVEATRALRLGRDDFEQTVRDYPEFALALIRTLFRTARDLIGETERTE